MKLTYENVVTRVLAVTVDQLNLLDSVVTLTSTFHGDLDSDSQNDVELIMAYEDQFDIEISDDAASKCPTPADIVALVCKRLKIEVPQKPAEDSSAVPTCRTVLHGSHLGDIQEWLRMQNVILSKEADYCEVDYCVFEDQFTTMVGSQYPGCWKQIPEFYTYVICKTNDALKCMPADWKLARIGRSVRNSDRGQLIKTDIALGDITLAEYLHSFK